MIETEIPNTDEVAGLLEKWMAGDRLAFDQMLGILYRDIHRIAVRALHKEHRLTIQPTAVVHEAYLRLVGMTEIRWQDRTHFLSMAARVTRQVLVDEARRVRASKRDGGQLLTLSGVNLAEIDTGYDALDVDSVLNELHKIDALAADVVSMRVFGGMSVEETAEVLGTSVATVNRRWATGKAWLIRELMPDRKV